MTALRIRNQTAHVAPRTSDGIEQSTSRYRLRGRCYRRGYRRAQWRGRPVSSVGVVEFYRRRGRRYGSRLAFRCFGFVCLGYLFSDWRGRGGEDRREAVDRVFSHRAEYVADTLQNQAPCVRVAFRLRMRRQMNELILGTVFFRVHDADMGRAQRIGTVGTRRTRLQVLTISADNALRDSRLAARRMRHASRRCLRSNWQHDRPGHPT